MRRKISHLIEILIVSFSVLSFSGIRAEPAPTPKVPSLVDASNAAKKRNATANPEKKSRVITNETVALGAHKGSPSHDNVVATPPADHTDQETEKKKFWRQKYRTQSVLIAGLEEQIEKVDSTIATLWLDFYASDSAERREKILAPRLNGSIIDKQDLQTRLIEETREFVSIHRAARIDGAMAGWFRDIQ